MYQHLKETENRDQLKALIAVLRGNLPSLKHHVSLTSRVSAGQIQLKIPLVQPHYLHRARYTYINSYLTLSKLQIDKSAHTDYLSPQDKPVCQNLSQRIPEVCTALFFDQVSGTS